MRTLNTKQINHFQQANRSKPYQHRETSQQTIPQSNSYGPCRMILTIIVFQSIFGQCNMLIPPIKGYIYIYLKSVFASDFRERDNPLKSLAIRFYGQGFRGLPLFQYSVGNKVWMTFGLCGWQLCSNKNLESRLLRINREGQGGGVTLAGGRAGLRRVRYALCQLEMLSARRIRMNSTHLSISSFCLYLTTNSNICKNHNLD